MAHRPPNRLEEFRIDGEIGDDPAELDAVAAEVVRGCSICYSRIKSLRALIEAVQRHPGARLALRREAPEEERGPSEALTALRIHGGELLDAECRSVDIRVTLTLTIRFAGDASFEDARFAGDASFDKATFAGEALFDKATFEGGASFRGASFAGDASFEGARFAGTASFDGTSFAGTAWYRGASFAGAASFEEASFAGGDASFDGARFAETSSFDGASFAGTAWFREAGFVKNASFDGASFTQDASFDGASFARTARFRAANFAGDASFGTSFAETASSFDKASFARAVDGDLRRCFLRSAKFGKRTSRLGRALNAFTLGIPRRIWRWTTREFSWQQVRALGQLQILNRVSLFALIAVPVLVACWRAVRALAGAYHHGVAESHAAMDRLLLQIERPASSAQMTDDARRRVLEVTEQASATSTAWQARLAEIVSESPNIGNTLAFFFFAAVCVTLGLLIYQVRAAVDVRKYDKDEFVDRVVRRYTEKARTATTGCGGRSSTLKRSRSAGRIGTRAS